MRLTSIDCATAESGANNADVEASLDNIDKYVEGMYEEIPDKINATRSLVVLARDPVNMETMIKNGTIKLLYLKVSDRVRISDLRSWTSAS